MLEAALDENKRIVFCKESLKGKDYFCPECKDPVRLRSGELLSPHFYHYQGSLCRHAKVGSEHLAVQEMFKSKFAQGCQLERWFPSQSRIADIFLPDYGLVIEVQYSPISPQEVLQRVFDYQTLGLEVIWILDFERFLGGFWDFGHLLCHLPHYYAKRNKQDHLQIFDYLEGYYQLLENFTLWNRDFEKTHSLNQNWKSNEDIYPMIWQRKQRWRVGFEGDFVSSI